jgi:L-arabinose isomerase
MTVRARVGLVGLGLEAYWAQFAGLEERLLGYVKRVEQKVAATGVDVVNLGMIDSPAKGMAAGHALRREDVDLLLIYVTTYALSATVLPMARRAKVPVVLLNLQPEAAIDYARFNAMGDRTAMTGEWLAYCSACPVPEIANVFRRAGIWSEQVTGTLDDAQAWAEIEGWVQAAQVVEVMAHCRTGLMGHYYSGMLDIYTDLTRISAGFGGHFEMLEVDELSGLREAATNAAVAAKVREFREGFEVQADCDATELERAARTSVALDAWVAAHELDALAYYYMGSGVTANEDTMSSIILGTSLLTGRGIPVAGEYEVKNVLAMKLMNALGAGGSFTEFYGVDFTDDIVLMGHDGPGHVGIAAGKVKVRPLQVYHGKVGRGLSVEMSVKTGPVTILSIVEDEGKFALQYAEGTVEAGPVLEIGNTNSRFRFSPGARGFIQAWNAGGPAHHCATGVGHVGKKIEKVAALLGLRAVRVC